MRFFEILTVILRFHGICGIFFIFREGYEDFGSYLPLDFISS